MISVGAAASGLYRKEAGTNQWQTLTDGMPPSPQARAIAIHPQHPEVVFVGTQRGVYRSQDGGDGWQRMHLPEGRLVWSLAFQPGTPQVLFLGTEGSDVYRSDDGGERWQYWSTIVNPDAVAINAHHPEQVYFCTRRGQVFGTHDGGTTWHGHRLPESAGHVISVACASRA